MTRRVSVFGATGSIGQNTIDLIARDPGRFDVVALTGGVMYASLRASGWWRELPSALRQLEDLKR